jgi:orotate phosphoribosyltransferase
MLFYPAGSESFYGSSKTSKRMSQHQLNKSFQKEFLQLLHARQGHFKLESGHHGNLWLDLDRLFLRPKAIQPFIDELTHTISTFEVDVVCGPMIGGSLIAQTIAAQLGAEFFYTERVLPKRSDALYSATYHLPNPLRTLIDGKRVAIVDDVINAGSAVRGTLRELQSLGAIPVMIGALLVLGETGQKYFAERNLPIVSVASLPNEIWTPENCALCASQMPLTHPG